MNSTIRLLVDWGKLSDDNKIKLINAYNNIIENMLSNNGQTIKSGNIGDLSYVYESSGVSMMAFAGYIKDALDIIDGKTPHVRNRIAIKYIR